MMNNYGHLYYTCFYIVPCLQPHHYPICFVVSNLFEIWNINYILICEIWCKSFHSIHHYVLNVKNVLHSDIVWINLIQICRCFDYPLLTEPCRLFFFPAIVSHINFFYCNFSAYQHSFMCRLIWSENQTLKRFAEKLFLIKMFQNQCIVVVVVCVELCE